MQIITWRVTHYYTLNIDFLHVSGSFTLYKMLYQYILFLKGVVQHTNQNQKLLRIFHHEDKTMYSL